MKAAILHLSDIHIHDFTNAALGRASQIASTMNTLLPVVDCVVLVITGDIAFSGEGPQYALASQFIDSLLTEIKSGFDKELRVVLVPGNHDGQFKRSSQARKTLIEHILQKGDSVIDASVIDICTQPQEDYFDFESSWMGERVDGDKLWREERIEVAGKCLSFSCINASWMSSVPEEPGKLLFPIYRYQNYFAPNCDVKIAVMHHPLNWYSQSSYHAFRDACRSHFQIIMSGHEHAGSTYFTDDIHSGRNLTFEAPALVSHEELPSSGFSVLYLDVDSQRVAQVSFEWDGKMYAPSQGLPIWDDFIDIPLKRSDGIEPTQQILNVIEDIGATFTHPNVERVSMSHLFVYPHLHDIDTDSLVSEPIRADVLCRQTDSNEKVIIRGEEQFGKTTLLHRLFLRYFEMGLTPILVSGKELHNVAPESFMRRILKVVGEQYGEDAPNRYSQISRVNKIVLVDDLDGSGVHPDAIGRTLVQLERHFDKIICTVSETFDLTEISSVKATEITRNFKRYRIAGFGLELRTEIIKRWMRLGSSLSEAELQKRVHDAQSVIDSVIGKGLVPTSALSVLILLQTIESGQRSALANAGLAQYYEYMVRRALLEARVKSDELDEVIHYMAGLAWMCSVDPSRPVELSQLEQYNSEFSVQIQRTDFHARLDLLLRARILRRVGSSYLFRYPYIRFFFKAQYIAANLEDIDELKEYVRHACKHLYLSENANTILFLTHHTSSKWIIREVGAVLSQLLLGLRVLDIKNDTLELNRWVTSTARLAVDVTDVEANRAKQRAKDDHAEQLPEQEPDTELASLNELDLVGQVNLLFKTSEILGQILKNRYGSLDRSLKLELISELLGAPLRGINVFLQAVISEPKVIVDMIGARLKEKVPHVTSEQADRIAQRFIFESLGNIADSFITRQGELIGSPKLMEDISSVADGNDTFRLVKVAAQLSYPNHIPFGEIEGLAKELRNNVFGFRLLQGLAARHLYMFSVPYDERQRLASVAKIDVQTNRAIDLKSGGVKKIDNRRKFEPRVGKSLILRLQSSYLARIADDKNRKREETAD